MHLEDSRRCDWYLRNFSSPTNITRQPTYDNLPRSVAHHHHHQMETEKYCVRTVTPSSTSSSSSSSSVSRSSRCSCRGSSKTNTINNDVPKKTAPQLRAPLMDIRNATRKTSLGKAVGTRAGWLLPEQSKPPISHNNRQQVKEASPEPVVVVSAEDRPPKLCSHRLRPARSVFDGFALSVLKSGTVVLEKLTPVEELADNRPAIREIIQVSADGEAITTAKLHHHVAFDSSRPTTIDKLVRGSVGVNGSIDVRTFRYDAMPRNMFGRYRCCANFVNILRAKTPKVTVNKMVKGNQVTCCLMESLTDCVVTFTLESVRNMSDSEDELTIPEPSVVVTYLPDRSVRLQAGKASLTLPDEMNSERYQVPKPLREMLAIASGLRSVALSVEKSISLSSGFAQFPIECGKRRATF